MKFSLSMVAIALFSALVMGCTKKETSMTGGPPAGEATLRGAALLGPVAGATVTVYALLADGTRGAVLGTTTTDAAGNYSLKITYVGGPVEVVITGGTYVDEATGKTVTNDTELLARLASVDTKVAGTAVASAMSTIAARNSDGTPEKITAANRAVAAAFNIPGDLVSILPDKKLMGGPEVLFAARAVSLYAQSASTTQTSLVAGAKLDGASLTLAGTSVSSVLGTVAVAAVKADLEALPAGYVLLPGDPTKLSEFIVAQGGGFLQSCIPADRVASVVGTNFTVVAASQVPSGAIAIYAGGATGFTSSASEAWAGNAHPTRYKICPPLPTTISTTVPAGIVFPDNFQCNLAVSPTPDVKVTTGASQSSDDGQPTGVLRCVKAVGGIPIMPTIPLQNDQGSLCNPVPQNICDENGGCLPGPNGGPPGYVVHSDFYGVCGVSTANDANQKCPNTNEPNNMHLFCPADYVMVFDVGPLGTIAYVVPPGCRLKHGCSKGCFTADVRIRMADRSEKLAAEIRKGDLVWNPVRKHGYRVLRTTVGPEIKGYMDITAGGRKLRVTAAHPILTPDGMVRADSLKKGSRILDAAGKVQTVTVAKRLPPNDARAVYNFELDTASKDPADHAVEANGIAAGDLAVQLGLATKRREATP